LALGEEALDLVRRKELPGDVERRRIADQLQVDAYPASADEGKERRFGRMCDIERERVIDAAAQARLAMAAVLEAQRAGIGSEIDAQEPAQDRAGRDEAPRIGGTNEAPRPS